MGKIIWVVFVLSFSSTVIIAQKKAVTENGDEVLLYPDGTWKYASNPDSEDSIATNPTLFKKSSNATFLLKSRNNEMGFWLDPKKWNFKKSEASSDAEFEIDLKGQSVQATIITENSAIPIESYPYIALVNGKSASPDLQIVSKEYRMVNNVKVLCMKMEGSQAGIKFCYSGYYFSTENATVQFITFTYKNLLIKYSKDIDEILNGLVELYPPDASSAVGTNATSKSSQLAQGSFSDNTNCKKYFDGKWQYDVTDPDDLKKKTVLIERTSTKTTEYTDNKKYFFEYATNWLNDCNYELVFTKTSKPGYKLMKPGEVIKVEINYISSDEMKYTATFREKISHGQMVASH